MLLERIHGARIAAIAIWLLTMLDILMSKILPPVHLKIIVVEVLF